MEEERYRETQEQHFGKRGMSYHGAVIYVNRALPCVDERLAAQHSAVPAVGAKKATAAAHQPYQMYYFDDVIANSQQQDSVAVASLIEATIARTKALFPAVCTMSFQADNAAAYSSPFLLFILPLLCAKHGVIPTEFAHNWAGDGKTVLDGHFGVQTHQRKVQSELCLLIACLLVVCVYAFISADTCLVL